jgi:hypothetical protein
MRRKLNPPNYSTPDLPYRKAYANEFEMPMLEGRKLLNSARPWAFIGIIN